MLGADSRRVVALLLIAVTASTGLEICQHADLCISFEHENVSIPAGWAFRGTQRLHLLTATATDICEKTPLVVDDRLERSQTVMLVRMTEMDSCNASSILSACSGRAGVIIAMDGAHTAGLVSAATPAVRVTLEEGLQILYLAKVVGHKVWPAVLNPIYTFRQSCISY